MDQALDQVNKVVFSNSFQESNNVYTKWSKEYDEDIKTLGCTPSLEAAKMLQSYGMETKCLLDVGGGKVNVV